MSTGRLQDLGAGRFRLEGEVDFDSVPELWAGSEAAFAPHASLEVDLDGVTRADSAAVALLLAWTRRAGAQAKTQIGRAHV